MSVVVDLYSSKPNDIYNFLSNLYDNYECKEDIIKWEKTFDNPTELADILGVFIDNSDKYSINVWVSLDDGFFINITENNVNKIIKYLYERYPY